MSSEEQPLVVACAGLTAQRLQDLIEAGLAVEKEASQDEPWAKVVVSASLREAGCADGKSSNSNNKRSIIISAASKSRSPRANIDRPSRRSSPPGRLNFRSPSPPQRDDERTSRAVPQLRAILSSPRNSRAAAAAAACSSCGASTAAAAPGSPSAAADSSAAAAQLESKVAMLNMAVERYKKELRRKDAKVAELEKLAAEGQETVTSFHTQQRALFDKFCQLRQKYDTLKAHLREVLWDYIPACRIPGVEGQGPPWLEAIPEVNRTILEDRDRVGNYLLGAVLGEGQFAAVRDAQRASDVSSDSSSSSSGALAVKMIDKSGVVNVTTLRRVDNEIAALQRLDHPGIMRLHDVVHAPTCIYLVTDKAGCDLFEFFDAHLDGVCEATAAKLLAKIMQPVAYCHASGICHRDLKPENILFADKEPFHDGSRIVLCDFGLSCRVETEAEERAVLQQQHQKQQQQQQHTIAPSDSAAAAALAAASSGAALRQLREFCGSPGFFAPEMLVKGAYNGKKADAWSLGCILLELVLGHEDFCRLWMGAYEYTNLKNAKAFDVAIQAASATLQTELPSRLSPELSDFLLTTLHLDPAQRLSVADMLNHPWMALHTPVNTSVAASLPVPPNRLVHCQPQPVPPMHATVRSSSNNGSSSSSGGGSADAHTAYAESLHTEQEQDEESTEEEGANVMRLGLTIDVPDYTDAECCGTGASSASEEGDCCSSNDSNSSSRGLSSADEQGSSCVGEDTDDCSSAQYRHTNSRSRIDTDASTDVASDVDIRDPDIHAVHSDTAAAAAEAHSTVLYAPQPLYPQQSQQPHTQEQQQQQHAEQQQQQQCEDTEDLCAALSFSTGSTSSNQRARHVLPRGYGQPPDAPVTPSVHAMRDEFIHAGDALASKFPLKRAFSATPSATPPGSSSGSSTATVATANSGASAFISPVISPCISPSNGPLKAFFAMRSRLAADRASSRAAATAPRSTKSDSAIL